MSRYALKRIIVYSAFGKRQQIVPVSMDSRLEWRCRGLFPGESCVFHSFFAEFSRIQALGTYRLKSITARSVRKSPVGIENNCVMHNCLIQNQNIKQLCITQLFNTVIQNQSKSNFEYDSTYYVGLYSQFDFD